MNDVFKLIKQRDDDTFVLVALDGDDKGGYGIECTTWVEGFGRSRLVVSGKNWTAAQAISHVNGEVGEELAEALYLDTIERVEE